jgi:hypothetical protein
MTRHTPASRSQSQPLDRRSLLRCFGAAALVLPAMLMACASSTPPRQYQRPPSHITGKDHRNGSPGEPNRVIYLK